MRKGIRLLMGSFAAIAGTGTLLAASGGAHPALAPLGQAALAIPTFTDAAAMMQRTTVVLTLLTLWMVVAVCLTLLSSREIRVSSVEIRSSPTHCFALGLVAVTSLVLTAILLTDLLPEFLAMPLVIALGVVAVITKVYGTIAVFHAVGSALTAARTRDALAGRRWLRGDLAMVVVGGLVLGVLRLIPWVGTIIWAGASVFGVGVALATRFGRREPWFLTWRPAES